MYWMFRGLFGLFAILFGVAMAIALALALYTLSLLPQLPTIESIKDVRLKVPLRIYSAEGDLIAEYGEELREPVKMEAVPRPLINAVLAAEDDAFFHHPGVDLTGVVRAAIANLRSRGHEQGASTITMQVARNYFLSPEKTYTRKLKEMMLAFRLERALTKAEILELYLNKIFLGHRAYGFAAAARVYYDKPLDQLNLAQIAMLAGLPKAPSRDNPLTNPDYAVNRRDYVLRRMHQLGHLSDEEFRKASGAAITARKHVTEADVVAPYLAEMVRAHMVDRYGEDAYWRGLKVFTTVKTTLQRAANRSLRDGLIRYDRRHGYRGPVAHHALNDATTVEEMDRLLNDWPRSDDLIPAIVIEVQAKAAKLYNRDRAVIEVVWSGLSWAKRFISPDTISDEPRSATDVMKVGDVVYVQNTDKGWRLSQLPRVEGALVSLRPADGAVLALTGGFDFYLSKFNRATQAQRQPGSNIKPFIYSAALDHGFTPATLVSGAPIVVPDAARSTVWRPENYSGKFFGPTRLRKALSLSLNLVSVRVVRALGVNATMDHMTRLGLDSKRLPRGLSLALGAGTLTPMEMVGAYAVFANGGFRVEPYFIDWVENRDGQVVEQANPTIVCGGCIPRLPQTAYSAEAVSPRQALRVLRPENWYLMTSMMRDVVRVGTGRRALQLGRNDLAGKTGTTNDFRDAWFSGFNSDLVTTVWVGFDDAGTLGRGEAGSRAALPIWIEYMRVALKGLPEKPLRQPDNVVDRFVSAETGLATSTTDPQGYKEYFVVGTAPAPSSDGPLADRPQASSAPGALPVPEGLF